MTDIEDDGRVRVLTVRQPHAHLLIHGSPSAGVKDVENRSRPTSYRGTLLIQASAKVDRAAFADYITEGVQLPPAEALVTGAIIGSVQVTGCVRESRSRWAIPGYWHWLTAVAACSRPGHPAQGTAVDVRRAIRLGGMLPPARLGAVRVASRLDQPADSPTAAFGSGRPGIRAGRVEAIVSISPSATTSAESVLPMPKGPGTIDGRA